MAIRLQDKMLKKLENLIGAEAAGKIVQLFESVNVIAAFEKPAEMLEMMEGGFSDERERGHVAETIWYWARAMLVDAPLDMNVLAGVVGGEKGAAAIMSIFDTARQIASYTSAMEFIDALKHRLPDQQENIKVGLAAYKWARALFAVTNVEGGVQIAAGAELNVGGDVTGRDKHVTEVHL